MEQLRALFIAEQGGLNIFGKILIALIILLIARVIQRIIEQAVKSVANSRVSKGFPLAKKDTILSILNGLIRFIIYFIAITMVLEVFGINTSSIIAAAGVGGIAIAFGAQSLVSDVISGFFILLDGEIQVGDYVTIDGKTGNVVDLDLRKTTVSSYGGELHYVPNSQIETITNYQRQKIQADILAEIPYQLPVSEVRAIIERLNEQYQDDERVLKEPYFVGIDQLGPYSYQAHIGIVTNPGDQWAVARSVRESFIHEMQEIGAYGDEDSELVTYLNARLNNYEDKSNE